MSSVRQIFIFIFVKFLSKAIRLMVHLGQNDFHYEKKYFKKDKKTVNSADISTIGRLLENEF